MSDSVSNRPYSDRLSPDVRFALLGRLEVILEGRDVAPTTPRTLALLALLLVNARRVVPTEVMVAELWGERPPARVRAAVQTSVYELRRYLSRLGIAEEADEVLVTRAPGYLLDVDPARIDLHDFLIAAREGKQALEVGRVDEAAVRLREAEELWAGPALANVACGAVLRGEAVALLERRHAARAARLDADLDRGRHRELVGELRSLCLKHPLDESLHAQLVRALGRCGRRSDAMATFRRLRDVLDTELGVEPGPEVAGAYAELIAFETAA